MKKNVLVFEISLSFDLMFDRCKIVVSFGLVVVLILFLVSPDSYLYDLYAHVDSSIFFVYGKAWMNGMVPYTDFTEPKGPLLFLIYGCGYLLSNYNCIGVFWISCLFYIGVYLYTYKVVGIFKRDKVWQFIITVAMSFFWFNPLVHYEIKTEDFAQFFFAMSFYYTCLLLYSDKQNQIPHACIAFGISFASLFLMKFNLAAMIGVFGIAMLYYAYQNGYYLSSILYMACGFMMITVPFLLYFSFYGSGIGTFLSEYFGTTLSLVSATGPQEPFLIRLFSFVLRPAPIIMLVVILLGVLSYSNHLRNYRFFPLVSFVWFYFWASVYGLSYYYYSTCALFGLFLLLWLLEVFPHAGVFRASKMRVIMVVLCVVVVVSVANMARAFINPSLQTLFFQETELRRDYYTFAYLMAQIDKPTWLAFCYPAGQDIPSGAIPACKTLGVLPGEKVENVEMRNRKIRNREIDFISVKSEDTDIISELKRFGYYPYQTATSKTILFSKYQLQMPPKEFYVSPMDVLLKKRIFNFDDSEN